MFPRRRLCDPESAIAEFWHWWPSARPRLTASIDAHDGGVSMVDEISAQVDAIHPELQWELSKGTTATHALVVSPGGNPALRAAAARWLAAAPAPDATWEFHDGRQRSGSFDEFSLRMDDHALEMSELRFGIITRGDEPHSIDVTVHHPAFPALTEDLLTQITYLALDWALGENGVEVWVGMVEPMTTMPPDPKTVYELRAVVDTMIERHREPSWAMMSGQLAGEELMATVQQPLRSARWPRFDTHVALVLPYAGNGFPDDASLRALRSFEDDLEPLLGTNGELIAHETRPGRRTLHYYVDGQSDLPRRLSQATEGWRRSDARVNHDPQFAGVRHLGG